MNRKESGCRKPLQELSKLLYVLPLVMVGLMVLGSQPAIAQIDPPDPNGSGSCNPAEGGSCGADDNLCTIEFCNPQTLQCDHRPTCPADGDQCTTEVCNPTNGACSSVPADPLPDGCQAEGCDPNAENPCPSDGNACTTDHCDPESHQCVNTPVVCTPDDNPCTSEVCAPESGCHSVPADPLPDQCQPGACDPNAENPCPANDDKCTPNVCDPESRTCVPRPVTCEENDDPCTTPACNPETGVCEPEPTNPPPEGCGGAICRTPGFWGTHSLAVTKKKAVNITQAVIAAAGGTLSICGKAITSTIVKDDNSAVEGICVSPSGDIRLQLARQLTAAALNCVMSGGGGDCFGTPLYSAVFSTCNATCGDLAATRESITQCIGNLDCLNNGGVMLANGFCQIGTCHDGTACKDDAGCLDLSHCTPLEGNCHDQPLVNSDLGLDFDPPGGAGSSSLCNSAIKSGCTVIGAGLVACTQ